MNIEYPYTFGAGLILLGFLILIAIKPLFGLVVALIGVALMFYGYRRSQG
jgi:hydrogenase/urease accessory protein HupE